MQRSDAEAEGTDSPAARPHMSSQKRRESRLTTASTAREREATKIQRQSHTSHELKIKLHCGTSARITVNAHYGVIDEYTLIQSFMKRLQGVNEAFTILNIK